MQWEVELRASCFWMALRLGCCVVASVICHQKHLAGLLADTLNQITQDVGWKSDLDAVSMKF